MAVDGGRGNVDQRVRGFSLNRGIRFSELLCRIMTTINNALHEGTSSK